MAVDRSPIKLGADRVEFCIPEFVFRVIDFLIPESDAELFPIENACNVEHGVADRIGVQAATILSPQQSIIGI